jgi:dTDP-4-amino-4,6-dideoxygalactose transaminase
MKIKKIPRSSVRVSKKEIFNGLVDTIFDKSDKNYVKKFEDEFAKYLGVNNAIAISSGRTAFYLILKSLNFKKGDEIIVPSYTVHIIPNIVQAVGLKPVFVDADENTFNINPYLIEEKITDKTRAVVPTHLFGQPCDMDSIMELAEEYGLKVIEDSCHSCGSEYKGKKTGTFGKANFFSFAIGKNLTTFGGGMITTDNDELAEEIRMRVKKFSFPSRFSIFKRFFSYSFTSVLSYPYFFTFTIYPLLRISNIFGSKKLDSLFDDPILVLRDIPTHRKKKFTNVQAKLGVEQLKRIDKNNEKRIKNAEFLSSQLNGLDLKIPRNIPKVKNIYLNYPIRVKNKENVAKELLKRGIDVKREYIYSCSSLSIFKKFKANCPVAKKLEKETLFLPVHSALSRRDLNYIIDSLKDLCHGRNEN